MEHMEGMPATLFEKHRKIPGGVNLPRSRNSHCLKYFFSSKEFKFDFFKIGFGSIYDQIHY